MTVTTPPEVNFNWPHLFLQLGQLARQVGHQFHGGLQLLLQASDLVLLPICITADQRHGPHPWEPVQVVVLKAQSMTWVQHVVTSEIPAFLQRSCLFYEVVFGPFPTIDSSFASSTRCCDFVKNQVIRGFFMLESHVPLLVSSIFSGYTSKDETDKEAGLSVSHQSFLPYPRPR